MHIVRTFITILYVLSISMSSTIDILTSSTLYINIYFGLFVCITGIIGDFLNIIVFTTLKTFRQTTCAVYLTTASIAGLGQSLTALVRVFSTGFNYGPTSSSILCKFRFSLSEYFSLVFLTCMCMATIDQYLSMTKYQQLNIIRLSRDRQLTAMALVQVLFFIISTIPFIVFFTHTLTTTAKNAEETARNQLIYEITTLSAYECYAVRFFFFFQRKIQLILYHIFF